MRVRSIPRSEGIAGGGKISPWPCVIPHGDVVKTGYKTGSCYVQFDPTSLSAAPLACHKCPPVVPLLPLLPSVAMIDDVDSVRVENGDRFSGIEL